jgi:hypothetical protein
MKRGKGREITGNSQGGVGEMGRCGGIYKNICSGLSITEDNAAFNTCFYANYPCKCAALKSIIFLIRPIL